MTKETKKENKRVLRLQTNVTFRRPRSWDAQVRYAILVGGQEVTVETGAWLLELGEVSMRIDDDQTEHLYRLATGEMVALDRPLAEGEAVEVADPQAVAAMNIFRTPEEAIFQDFGITLETTCRSLVPFRLIKCPICAGIEFTSNDLASAWCDRCGAQFTVRSTAGDPGWVVDVQWSSYSYLSARYVMPRTDRLSLCLVLKNSGNPLDMTHDPEEWWCWQAAREGTCRPDALRLTDDNMGLRPGLHYCNVGDMYDWSMVGQVPTPESLNEDIRPSGWEIDGQRWPGCATIRALRLESGERQVLEEVARGLRRTNLPATGEQLERLAEAGREPAMVYQVYLPPVSVLQEGEYYLLHHWVTVKPKLRQRRPGWPVWYVVRPVMGEYGRIEKWDVLRRDICPRCGKQVQPDDLKVSLGDQWLVPHGTCRKTWSETGWQPQFQDEEV